METFNKYRLEGCLITGTKSMWGDIVGDINKQTDLSELIDEKMDTAATKEWVESKHYLTEHQSLEGYATENWVESQGYLTEHQDLTDYALKSWVEDKHYLTQHQDLSDYAKLEDIPSLEGYATEYWVLNKDYATKSYVDTLVGGLENITNEILS